jgi:beta propeller repeat protein
MKMKARALAGLVLIMVSVYGAGAAVLNVPDEYESIQKGIDAAVDGDTVLVAPGLYFERINFHSKNIMVTSTDPNDSSIVGYTIINGQKQGSVVTFEGGESSRAVLSGFTITGGTGMVETSNFSGSGYVFNESYYYGGGIYCAYGSPTITHNVIVNNSLPGYEYSYTTSGSIYTYTYTVSYGGGIYASGSPTIKYNVIYRNTAYRGGGMYCYGGTISNNLIYDNSGTYGGGAYFSSSYGTFTNNTLVGNDASLDPDGEGYGGNLYLYLGYDYYSNTIANNLICSADSGGGVYWYGYVRKGTMFRYNNVWGNTPCDYMTDDARTGALVEGDEAAWTGKNGNVSANPVFATGWSVKYRLSETSPCVSAGDPNFVAGESETDIDGDPRVYALRVDIGADEHIGYVKPIAEAGPARHVLTPEPVTLDGSDSYVSDSATSVSYRWTQIQGAPVSLNDPVAAQPTFTPPALGWYVFELVVSDDRYVSSPDQVLVVVGNERPVANAGSDKLCQTPGTVTLDGSKSYDADPPDRLVYTWKQIEGPEAILFYSETSTPFFYCFEPVRYVFELVVNDGFTDSEPDRVTIEAAPFTIDAETQEVTTEPTTSTSSYPYYFYCASGGTAMVYAGSETTSSPTSWSIFRADPKTGEVVKYDSGNLDIKPKVDGDITVWVGGSGDPYSRICTSLCAANVTTGTGVTTLQGATSNTSYGYPALSGRTVVYLRHTNVNTASDDYDNTSFDVCGTDVTDFAHPVHFTIAAKAGHGAPYPAYDYPYSDYFEDCVDVSGNIVVWEKDGDIYGADISDRGRIRVFPICTAAERQYDPAVSGNIVVWTDERNDGGDIYGADISDPNNIKEFEVDVSGGWQSQPDVDGSVLVYVNGSESGYIRVCTLTRNYGPVAISFGNQTLYGSQPSVHGTVIAWVDQWRSYQISCARVDIAYALAGGRIENASTGNHYDYIQHAIVAASDGDVIVVPPGTYDERLRFGGKNVTVKSTNPEDPNVRSATIIQGDGQLVTFGDEETAECLFTGFTVTGGSYGIHCRHAWPTITWCTVTGNRDAGLKLWALAKPTVSRCDITGNGIGVEMSTETIVRLAGYAAPTLQNCLIVGNRKYGVYGGEPAITNCTIADNGSQGVFSMRPKISNSIVYFNNAGGENVKGKMSLAASYNDTQDGVAGQGNIKLDPCFALRGAWVNGFGATVSAGQADPNAVWAEGDYHVASQGWRWNPAQQIWVSDSTTSPCIDAGDPASSIGDEKTCGAGDPLGERTGANTRINMGAYGGTAEASLAPKS